VIAVDVRDAWRLTSADVMQTSLIPEGCPPDQPEANPLNTLRRFRALRRLRVMLRAS